MAASTVGRMYTHTSAQCSPTSVGLAQARPNYLKKVIIPVLLVVVKYHFWVISN